MSFFTRKPADSASAVPAASSLDTFALTLVREHDQGLSLMDRAQRQRQTQTEFGARAQALLQQAATSPLPQEAQLAALDRQSEQLADAERTQLGYRRLREAYKAGELELSLKAISAISDPIDQRQQLTQLRSRYAPFALNPELAQRIDTQFDTVEPVVQRNEQALALRGVRSGRYAPTLAEARRAFPGRRIHTLADPAGGTILFVPGDGVDPHQEAEAIQLIDNARARAETTGDLTELDSLRDDATFRSVSRVPGNRVSALYNQTLASLRQPSASTTAPDPDTQPLQDVILHAQAQPDGLGYPQGAIDGSSRGGSSVLGIRVNPVSELLLDRLGRRRSRLGAPLSGSTKTIRAGNVILFEPVHQIAIDRALAHLPEEDRAILRAQQVIADEDQTPENQSRHALRDGRRDREDRPRETLEQARQRANAYVRERILAAQQSQRQGNRAEAMRELGLAIHTLQDSTSPSHRGFQPWGGPGSQSAAGHVRAERKYPGDDSELFRITQRALEYFNGTTPLPDDFFGP